MRIETKYSARTSALVTLAAVVIVVAGLKEAQAIIVPFLLAVFIAVISAPPLLWLESKGLPRVLALLLVVLTVALGVTFIGGLIGSSLDNFSNDLPTYEARLKAHAAAFLNWLQSMGVQTPQSKLLDHMDGGEIFGLARNMLTGLSSVLGNAFLIFLTVLFILFETESFPTKLRVILDKPDESMVYISNVVANIRRYLAIKTITSLITGMAIAVWLAILDVNYPILWGILAFLLNYIPNIGSILAAVPAVLFALVQVGSGTALWSAIGYLIVNNVIGNIVEPRFMGKGMGLSTLVVFVSLVFWGWVFGPVGMFLSVPLTMTVKIALEANENTRWMAILMGSEQGAKAVLKESAVKLSDSEVPSPPTDST